jgi:hypothetical protein
MNIKNKLYEIGGYYMANRQAGHTYTLLNGAVNNDEPVIVIVGNANSRRLFDGVLKKKDRVITLEQISGTGALRGYSYPMVIDNHAMSNLCSESLHEIENLEAQNTALKKAMDEVLKVNERLEDRNETFQKYIATLEIKCELYEKKIDRIASAVKSSLYI